MIQEIDENDKVTYTYSDDFTYYAYTKSIFDSIWMGDHQVDLFLIWNNRN